MRTALRRFDNRLKRFRALTFALNVTLFAIVTQAQQTSTKIDTQQPSTPTSVQLPQDNTGRRRIQARRVSDTIKIDGLLDEPAWALGQPATDFLQEWPTEGAAASERTEVRVLFDDKTIYFGIRAFDSDA